MKSLGLGESVTKLKEHDISDVFFEFTDDKLIELLDIKTEGKKFRFKEKIKEIKDKYEKAKAKKILEEEQGAEIVTPKFELL